MSYRTLLVLVAVVAGCQQSPVDPKKTNDEAEHDTSGPVAEDVRSQIPGTWRATVEFDEAAYPVHIARLLRKELDREPTDEEIRQGMKDRRSSLPDGNVMTFGFRELGSVWSETRLPDGTVTASGSGQWECKQVNGKDATVRIISDQSGRERDVVFAFRGKDEFELIEPSQLVVPWKPLVFRRQPPQ